MRLKLFPLRFKTFRFSQKLRVTGRSVSLFLLRVSVSSLRSLPIDGGKVDKPVLSRASFFKL